LGSEPNDPLSIPCGLQDLNDAKRGYAKCQIGLYTYVQICKNLYVHMPELSAFTAEFFKTLAHPLRIKILDALRRGEVGVNDLSTRLEVEQSTLSQQLAVLRKSNIVVGRKEAQNVFYSVRDPAIFRLLDEAKQVFNNHLIDIRDLLAQLTPSGGK